MCALCGRGQKSSDGGRHDDAALARADIRALPFSGTDIAIESADIVLMKSDLKDAATAIQLQPGGDPQHQAQFVLGVFLQYAGHPAGGRGIYGALGWRLSPMFGAAAMSLSSVCVVTNALRLRGFKPKFAEGRSRMPASEGGIEPAAVSAAGGRADRKSGGCGGAGRRHELRALYVEQMEKAVGGRRCGKRGCGAARAAVRLAKPVSDQALLEAVRGHGSRRLFRKGMAPENKGEQGKMKKMVKVRGHDVSALRGACKGAARGAGRGIGRGKPGKQAGSG